MQHVSEESASQSNETNDLPELSRYRAPTVPNRYMGPSVQHGMPPVYPSAGVLQHPPVAAQVRTHVVRDVLHQLCIPQLPSGFTSKIPIPYLSLIPRIFEIEGILGTGITSTVYSATVHQDVLVQDVNLRHKFTYSYAIPPYVRQSSMRSAPRANILLCDTVPVVALKVYHCDLLPFLTAPIPPRTIDCHTIPPPQCRTFRSHIDDGIRPSHSNLYSRSHDPFAKVGNDRYFRDLFEESQFQHLLNHPNLAKIYASWFELGKHERFEENVEKAHMLVHQRPHHDTTPRIRYSICLAMELCEGISLEEYFEYLMRSTQRTHRVERQANVHEGCQTQSSTAHRVVRLHVVDEPMIRHILGQLIAALYHLHHVQNVIHRDLKPENIMLCGFDPRRIAQSDDADPNTSVNGESAWILKLIDFGCSMRLMYGSEILQDYIGTVPYMSPQVVTTSAYTTKTDMWSLGVILYEMLLGMSPFSEVRTGDDMRSALARWVKPKSLVPLDDSGKAQPLPPDLAEMCLQLLEKEERKRPSAKKLLRRFPWCRAYLQPEDAVGYLDRWL